MVGRAGRTGGVVSCGASFLRGFLCPPRSSSRSHFPLGILRNAARASMRWVGGSRTPNIRTLPFTGASPSGRNGKLTPCPVAATIKSNPSLRPPAKSTAFPANRTMAMPSPTEPAPTKAICAERSFIASHLPQATHTTVLGMSPESEEPGNPEAGTSGKFDFDLIAAGAFRAIESLVRPLHQS